MAHHAAGGKDVAELRVRLAADPASVPGARRFVADGLHAWGRSELVDDATLCVSELAGNAALHSQSSFMEIVMRSLDHPVGGVRISVEDHGTVPSAAVVPRPSFPDADDDDLDVLLDDEPTTGRGLAIVSILASDWGVEDTAAGKRIWVELTAEVQRHGVQQPQTAFAAETDAPVLAPAGLPDGWVLVRLAGCPVDLSLRQDQHLDELIRELQLVAADVGNPRSEELAIQMQGLLSGPAHARHTGRRTAQVAAAEGKSHIDVEMAMPREFAAAVVALQELVLAADRLCTEMRLLTLASPPELTELRAWMTEEIVRQAEQSAAPTTWDDWRRAARSGSGPSS